MRSATATSKSSEKAFGKGAPPFARHRVDSSFAPAANEGTAFGISVRQHTVALAKSKAQRGRLKPIQRDLRYLNRDKRRARSDSDARPVGHERLLPKTGGNP